MGLFKHTQTNTQPQPPADQATDDAAQAPFFDEYYREELRNHGRWYFEKIITENGNRFKADLDATLQALNTNLQEQVTHRLDESLAKLGDDLNSHAMARLDSQIDEYGKRMKEAQDAALQTMTKSLEAIMAQQHELSDAIQKTISDEKTQVMSLFEESKSQISAIKDTQNAALQQLMTSVHSLEERQRQLGDTLEKTIENEKAVRIKAFDENMARVVERYLLEAVGDSYDLRAQLPSIIRQLDEQKQAIKDDISL